MKALYSFIALTLVLALSSCDGKRSQLKRDLAQANAQCPMQYPYGSITSITLDGDDVVYNVVFSDDETYELFKNIPDDEIKQMMLLSLNTQGTNISEIIDMMRKYDVNLLYKFSHGNDSFSVQITIPDVEQRNIQSSTDSKAAMLDTFMAAYNRMLPEEIEEGMFITEVFEDDNAVTYVVEIDPELYDMDALEEAGDQIKPSVAESFKGPDTREFLDLLIDLNLNLAYRLQYPDNSRSFELVFTPAELKNCIGR